MSKNMIRKGLALGLGTALLTTAIVATPAIAAVDDNAVSLVPSTGAQYSMVSDGYFDLKSTQSTSAASSTGTLSYKVTDTASISKFDYQAAASVTSTDTINQVLSTVLYTAPTGDTLDLTFTTATDTVVISSPVDEDIFANLNVGDTVLVTGLAATGFAATTGYLVVTAVNANKDAFTVIADSGASSDIGITALTAGTIVEVPVLPFNGAQTATGTADIFTMAYVASTDIVTITSPVDNNQFKNLAAGDMVSVTGMNSAGITTAFTGLVEVLSVTGEDVFTFKALDLKATNITTEDLSAGTFQEVSSSDTLDTRATILAGQLGTVDGLSNPTRAANGSYVIVGPDAVSTNTDYLRLVASAAGTVTVQAWVDNNADGVIDSTESASSIRTVTFVTWANSGALLNIATPIAGQDWAVHVSFNSDINASQIPATRLDVALGVLDAGALESGVSGTTVSSGVFNAWGSSLVFDSTSHVPGFWGFKGQVASNLAGVSKTDFVAGYTYVGQIGLDGAAYGSNVYTNIGNAVADAVGAVAATRGDNVRQSGTAVTVREDYTGQVEFKVLLTDTDATIAAASGVVPVPAGTEATVTVAKGADGLNVKSTVTTNGLTLTNASTAALSYTATTDASGYVTFSLMNNFAEVGDDLDVTVTHAGTAVTASVVWAAHTAANSVLSGATVISIEKTDSYSIAYTAVDDFGAALAGPAYRVEVQYYDAIGGVQKTTAVNLDANGKGTLTVTDLSTTQGQYAVNADLQKLNTSAAYADYGSPEEVDSVVYVVANKTPAAITLVSTVDTAGGATPTLETLAISNVDASGPNGNAAPAVDTDEHWIMSGLVTNSSGAFVQGGTVTLTAPGVLFVSGTSYTVGSATVSTDNAGAYSVDVYTNTAGSHTITATAGTVSKTKAVLFDAALESSATQLVVDAPVAVASGSSYTVKVSLKDAFGNPVATTTAAIFTLSYSGAGIALSQPSDTNSAGEASFAVLLGSNDNGTGTIVATYDADSSATTVDNNLSVTKTVAVGSGAVAGDTVVNVGSFSGKLVVYANKAAGDKISYKIAGKWVVQNPTSNSLQRYDRVVAAVGVTVLVDIYVNGVKKLSKSVVTK